MACRRGVRLLFRKRALGIVVAAWVLRVQENFALLPFLDTFDKTFHC